tara:strand:+ start:8102 stop:9190 length:1089 start_codon:yes stop_codon:yes gene_type:complete
MTAITKLTAITKAALSFYGFVAGLGSKRRFSLDGSEADFVVSAQPSEPIGVKRSRFQRRAKFHAVQKAIRLNTMNRRQFCSLIAASSLASSVAGCATWIDRSTADAVLNHTNSNPLAAVKPSSQAMVLSVDFHPIQPEAVTADRVASMWQWVDEMIIEPAHRSELAENGIRVGKVIRPDQFRQRLAEMAGPRDVVDVFLGEADVASEVSVGSRKIPMRLAKRYELPLRQPRSGAHVTLLRTQGQTVGRTLQDPQYVLAITPTQSKTASQIHLQCRPEIQHGVMRQKWISSDSAMRIDSRRDAWSLPWLDIDLEGGKGDLFVIAASQPAFGLGKEMMSGVSADNIEEQVVVLIQIDRLAESKL